MTLSSGGGLELDVPLVSAVIPTRARPQLVVRAVKSALAQTWRNMEVVVVADGADPETMAALQTVKDYRLNVVALHECVGGSEARNIGARLAKGAWVALLDDDDEWLEEKVEKQMAAASGLGDENVLIACQFIHRAEGVPDMVRPRRMPRAGEPIVEFMFDYLCYFQTSTMLCSTKLFRRIPFQHSTNLLFDDIDWFLRLNKDSQVQFRAVAEPLSIYYDPAQRKTVSGNYNWRDRIEWGRTRREIIGAKSYARFIVGSCASRASQERAGIRGLVRLFYETAIVGSASPRIIGLLFGVYLLPDGLRGRIRDIMILRKWR